MGRGPRGKRSCHPATSQVVRAGGGGDADRLSRGLRTSWSCLSAGEFRGLMITDSLLSFHNPLVYSLFSYYGVNSCIFNVLNVFFV